MAEIYVASSWRNACQPAVVTMLRQVGYTVYDFRQPIPGDSGFHWSSCGFDQTDRSAKLFDRYLSALASPEAVRGYGLDFEAMLRSDACVLVLPSGNSAHLEAGWFTGMGRPVFAYMPEEFTPELMYKMIDGIFRSFPALVAALDKRFAFEVDVDDQ